MHCPNCGILLEQKMNFCYSCGFDLRTIVKKDKVPAVQDVSLGDSCISLSKLFDDSAEIVKLIVRYSVFSNLLDFFTNIEQIENEVQNGNSSSVDTLNYIFNFDATMLNHDFDISIYSKISNVTINAVNDNIEDLKSFNENYFSFFDSFRIDDDGEQRFAVELQSIARNDMSVYYMNLISKINSLKSHQNYWNSMVRKDKSEDLASFAQYFGGGALAAAMPIIGIPVLVGKYFSDKNKEHQNNDKIDEIDKIFKDLIVYLFDSVAVKAGDCLTRIEGIIDKRFASLKSTIDDGLNHLNGGSLETKSALELHLWNRLKKSVDELEKDDDTKSFFSGLLNENISSELKTLLKERYYGS